MAFTTATSLRVAPLHRPGVNMTSRTPSMKVVVAGATGRTGRLVYNLLVRARVPVTGLVRDKQKALSVLGEDANLSVVDIADRAAVMNELVGAKSLVLLTSAIPILQNPGPPPVFSYPPDGMPEAVDWRGAVNLFDGAKSAGVGHFVYVGSMGSTDENHPLNKIGNGNILIWKRKAEQYLIDSGIPYTIINPAGLVDREPGQNEIIFGKADNIFDSYSSSECAIARGDVARVVVAALEYPNSRNKAFDVASHARPGFTPTMDFTELFEQATPELV